MTFKKFFTTLPRYESTHRRTCKYFKAVKQKEVGLDVPVLLLCSKFGAVVTYGISCISAPLNIRHTHVY